MARPTKLTPDTQQKVVQALSMGATYDLASQYAGISYNTFNEWRKRGAAELDRRDNPRVKPGSKQWEREQPFVEFYEAVEKAEGQAAVKWLAKIEAAAADHWQAAAWKLERRYPDKFGRTRVDHKTDITSGGEPLRALTAEDLSDDDLAAVIASGEGD